MGRQSIWEYLRSVYARYRQAAREVNGQVGVVAALEEIAQALPFRLLGIDTDNGSEFLKWHVGRWCAQHDIQFTRGRPYKKDDNAHIEQKNWTHVRKLMGWERYDTAQAVEAMNDLYRQELRLWMNVFQPSVKLVRKVRVGARLRRVYEAAQTPLQRVQASGEGEAEALGAFAGSAGELGSV